MKATIYSVQDEDGETVSYQSTKKQAQTVAGAWWRVTPIHYEPTRAGVAELCRRILKEQSNAR